MYQDKRSMQINLSQLFFKIVPFITKICMSLFMVLFLDFQAQL